jgi:hypothetical protein
MCFLLHLVNDSLQNLILYLFNVESHHTYDQFWFSWIWTHFDTRELEIYFLFFNRNVRIYFCFVKIEPLSTLLEALASIAVLSHSILLHVSPSLFLFLFLSVSDSLSLPLALYRVTRCVAAYAIFAVGRGLFHQAAPYSTLSSSSRIHRSLTGDKNSTPA